jgi:Uma2 family endonuclease
VARFLDHDPCANKQVGQVYAPETGFILTHKPDTVLAPDVAFVSKDRFKSNTDEFLTVAPDLAVEVISPSNTASEINEKTVRFFNAGTRQIWIVYPKTRLIHVYSAITEITVLGIDDTLGGSNVLPDFKVSVREIFSVLDS